MQIRLGYELVYSCVNPTPMILMLHVHPSRVAQLVSPDKINANPSVPIKTYKDCFGNLCTRIVAPAGDIVISAATLINDSSQPDDVNLSACQHPVDELPDKTLVYLMGSRYCETDRLSQIAWNLFGHTNPGWERAQYIVDYVHQYVTFGYGLSRPTKSAWETWQERNGVCRDFAHLALTFLRCMNIPARYCTGYLSDIGIPPPYAPMDFAAWIEVYLNNRWYVFDPRNNARRVGRVLIAQGRDAADVPLTNSFGLHWLKSFTVVTEEVQEGEASMNSQMAM